MRSDDWINLCEEWSKAVFEQEIDEVNMFDEERPKGKVYKFIYIGMTRPKAKFFVTDTRQTRGAFGFWCPNAAIIRQSKDTVEIADWCEIKEILFT